jgi:predicted HAD superfamily Cof-like phosphohydrolase
MHKPQEDVQAMHEALGIPVGNYLYPKAHRSDLRATLIQEEADELIEALQARDFYGVIKEMCDVLVVTYGCAVEFGVPVHPFWDEVHASNMRKQGGPVRPDGKILKPDGWLPADIEGVFDRIYG